MVEFWTAISFGKPDKVPHGVSRRLFCPLPWEPTSLDHWTLIKLVCVFNCKGMYKSKGMQTLKKAVMEYDSKDGERQMMM
ncbi:hypothetical protein Lal_00037689 [Lupinus albus]|nr:hypothetical protein Lal_00037689 [Lupinus albus]